MSLLRGYTFGTAGDVLTSRSSPTKGAQRLAGTAPKASGTMPMGGSGKRGKINHEEVRAT